MVNVLSVTRVVVVGETEDTATCEIWLTSTQNLTNVNIAVCFSEQNEPVMVGGFNTKKYHFFGVKGVNISIGTNSYHFSIPYGNVKNYITDSFYEVYSGTWDIISSKPLSGTWQGSGALPEFEREI